MKLSILNEINKARFYKEKDIIYCSKDDQIYQLISDDMLSDFLVRYDTEIQNENNQFMLTTSEHYKILDVKLVQTDKLDLAIKTRSEERVLSILNDGIKKNASDIHFTRQDETAFISFRINGQIVLYREIVSNECDEFLFVLYNVMASTKETTWNTKTPQDANVIIDIDNKTYRFRYSHMPIFTRDTNSSSYHAVVRVIYQDQDHRVCTSLSDLKLFPEEEKIIDSILSNPSGLFIVSGVTGTGKSTSLKHYMEYLYNRKYHQKGCFITVEDPVEFVIHGAQQSSLVKSKDGENLFSEAIRYAMRRDPNVLMIGEIRDNQTGEAIASAVDSGHLCLTTVHAGNVIGVLQRLNGLGIGLEKLIMPGFIIGITNQKLIPILCPTCSNDELNEFKRLVKTQGEGCDECEYHGIVSRKVIIEQLVPDLVLLKHMADQDWISTYDYFRSKRNKEELGEGYSIKDKYYYCCLEGLACYSQFKSSYGLMEADDEYFVHAVYQSKK